jgi:hypothetical protein
LALRESVERHRDGVARGVQTGGRRDAGAETVGGGSGRRTEGGSCGDQCDGAERGCPPGAEGGSVHGVSFAVVVKAERARDQARANDMGTKTSWLRSLLRVWSLRAAITHDVMRQSIDPMAALMSRVTRNEPPAP